MFGKLHFYCCLLKTFISQKYDFLLLSIFNFLLFYLVFIIYFVAAIDTHDKISYTNLKG